MKDTSIPLPVWLGSGRSNARNRICRTVWLLCLLLLLGSCAATTRVGESKAALWKVQGDHNTVYLLGTIHVLSKQAYPLKPALERAFDDANQVLLNQDKLADPATQDVLFARRNSKWVPEIERFAHGDATTWSLSAPGTSGDDGVVAQLRRAGYSVQQL